MMHARRAATLAESWEMRRYVRQFGRLPGCRFGLLEFDELVAWLRAHESERDPSFAFGGLGPLDLSVRYIAARCRVAEGTAHRWVRDRGVSRRVGERVAHELGVHPVEIWLDYFFDIDDRDDADHAGGGGVVGDRAPDAVVGGGCVA